MKINAYGLTPQGSVFQGNNSNGENSLCPETMFPILSTTFLKH